MIKIEKNIINNKNNLKKYNIIFKFKIFLNLILLNNLIINIINKFFIKKFILPIAFAFINSSLVKHLLLAGVSLKKKNKKIW